MKVRMGVGLGSSSPGDPATFATLVDRMEKLGIDSLWLPDTTTTDLPDPLTGLAFAAGRTTHLKLGTGVTVLPGRHPAHVAKQLATLADLAPGRILPAFGLRPARAGERALFPVPGPRGQVLDETLAAVRALLDGEDASFAGRYFAFEHVTVRPRPPRPLDLWLGGAGPAALDRVGRLADGWLGAFVTPAEAGAARRAIERSAERAGRTVDPEHFGVSLAVAFGQVPEGLAQTLRERAAPAEPEDLVPVGWAAARRLIGRYVDEGVSKFVVRPAGTAPDTQEAFLDAFAAELVPLQT